MEDIKLYKMGEQQSFNFHEVGFFKLIWVERGIVNISLDLTEKKIKGNHLLLILPDTEIKMAKGPKTAVSVISFSISIVKING